MDWLRRRRAPPLEVSEPATPAPEPLESAAPGVASLFAGRTEERSLAVLDLGPAADQSLQVYGRFARWVRFADLLGEMWPRAPGPVFRTRLPKPERPYDIVFAWDILDRLFEGDRPGLVEWLADLTAPDARLHVLVRSSEEAVMRPLRFVLLDVNRFRYEPTSSAQLPPSRLKPADVARVLAPFQVVHAFTLRSGFREYVAVRR